jgi:hypothetical protein
VKRLLAVAAVCSFVAGVAAAAEVRGAWTAEVRDGSSLQMNLTTHDRNHNHGESMMLSDFTDLADAALRATQQTPVSFSLRREAGNANFEGTFKDGFGAGQFTFNANPAYVATLRTLGVTFEEADHDEQKFLTMALLDVSTSFIQSMQAEGYRVSGEKYLEMRIFRITPDLVRELRGLGYDKIETDDLIATRIHKVTPDYIRSMTAAGYAHLSLDNLVASRIHKATPEFLSQMKDLGYGNLNFDDAIAFRIHRVTPEFVHDLRDLGYTNVSADNLVAMRIHRVTPEFIRELKDAGYEHIPVEKLIEMRIHGIDANFVKKMNKDG